MPGADLAQLLIRATKWTREPEPIPIRCIPGLRDAIEPLNRIIRIRADAAGGFDDRACAPDHSVAFLHGFAALKQTRPEDDLRWADSSLYVLGTQIQSTKRALDGGSDCHHRKDQPGERYPRRRWFSLL